MQLVEVNNKATRQEFLEFPRVIYKNDENWIEPIQAEIEGIFNPSENKLFKNGKVKRWILTNKKNETIGRIAAFYHETQTKEKKAGIGFYECIDDLEASKRIFDAAINWLKQFEINKIQAPINFGERNQWWGLLVKGFHPPTYGSNYHPKYYRKHFEQYGFQLEFKQFTYRKELEKPLPAIIERIAVKIISAPEYDFRPLNLKEIPKFAADFSLVYNSAWSSHEAFEEMTEEKAKTIIQKMKPIVDDDLIWFAYHQQKAIGFFVAIPDINPIIKKLKGKFNFWNKLKFVYHKKRKIHKDAIGIIFGVAQDFQGKGIVAGMIKCLHQKQIIKKRYKNIELNWIGDFNPKMIKLVERIEMDKFRTFHTYFFEI